MQALPASPSPDLAVARVAARGACGDAPLRAVVRLGRRTKLLARRIQPGEIAVISHRGLDPLCASELLRARPAAVLNCQPSVVAGRGSGGAQALADAGVALVDLPDERIFAMLADGQRIELRDGEVRSRGAVLARGTPIAAGAGLAAGAGPGAGAGAPEDAREAADALARFARNTLEHVVRESDLLHRRLELPALRTKLAARDVLVVARGADHRADLAALAGFIARREPVVVGVDGGADAVLDAGLRPSLIVGDMDSARDDVLRCGAELVVHAYADGFAPGSARLRRLGLAHHVFRCPGLSQDAALLLAAESGARLIVAVGAATGLGELLDRGRRGMASTLLTRLRVAEILVDARGVRHLLAP